MDQVIRMKRDQFRVSIRAQYMNAKFSENRKRCLLGQDQTLDLVRVAQQWGLACQDQQSLNAHIECALMEPYNNRSDYMLCIDMLAREF
jgi:hypothetical protein